MYARNGMHTPHMPPSHSHSWPSYVLRGHTNHLDISQRYHMQAFSEHMPLSPMLASMGSAGPHLQPGLPSDAAADAEAMWHLSNHLNNLQLHQTLVGEPCLMPCKLIARWTSTGFLRDTQKAASIFTILISAASSKQVPK